MAVKCVSAGGVPVDVMTPGDSGGSVGEVADATITKAGIVKQAAPVADVVPVEVTDISSAQEAIAEMGTTLAELMQSLRNAGVLGVSGS